MTAVSGSFRTLVGSVFGIALYVLVEGNLLPLEVSEPAPITAVSGAAATEGEATKGEPTMGS